MADADVDVRTREYLERWATLFETFGTTPMVGRLAGWLLICDPAEQSAHQIAGAVGVSLSSVSTAMKTLLSIGLVERVRRTGERSTFYRLRPGRWGEIIGRRLAAIRSMRELAASGLKLRVAGGRDQDPKEGRRSPDRRVEEVLKYCDFIEREFIELMERWKEERSRWEEE